MASTLSWDRLLQSQGFGSRKACQALVAAGLVQVGTEIVEDFRQCVLPEGLIFSVDGVEWRYRAKLYIALNKPANFECSRKPSHHPGILTLLPGPFRERDLQPVGRLDHDTTGLLLLSDDGAFIHAQSSPKRQVPKLYGATTHDAVSEDLRSKLLAGVKLHDEPRPLAATHCAIVSSHELEIVVEQGKYHQVKRMLAAAGNHCVALRRSAIGGLTLDSLALAEGQWRYLEAADLERLTDLPRANE